MMDGKPQEIPIPVPFPVQLAPKVNLRTYIPKISQ